MVHLKNLPKISNFEKNFLLDISNDIISSRLMTPERFGNCYKDTSNIVLSRATMSVPIVSLENIKNSLKKILNFDLSFGLLVLKPQLIPSFFPPHNDGLRNSGLNFVLQSGGKSVVTRFYKKPYEYTKDDRNYWNEESLEFTDEYTCLENEWYAFDPQLPHAVYNIEDTRIILMCMLTIYNTPMNFSQFKEIIHKSGI